MTKYVYGGITAEVNYKADVERLKMRLIIEIARELKTPTSENWQVCRYAALSRAAAAVGGSING